MKRTFQFLALVAICCAMMVSCKNNKQSEPTPEEIQAQKVALADSVLAEIDAIANEYMLVSDNAFRIVNYELTEEEKMVKPDYLLDPSFASTLVTKSQKVNALAIFLTDLTVRKIYDMPLDETKEVIAKLAVEINHPIDINVSSDFEIPISEKIKKEYEACKERGDLDYFWQFQYATIAEVSYVLSQNPELFFSKITEDQMDGFQKRWVKILGALIELAQYDETMSDIYSKFQSTRVSKSVEDAKIIFASMDAIKDTYSSNKDKFTNMRNALLQ